MRFGYEAVRKAERLLEFGTCDGFFSEFSTCTIEAERILLVVELGTEIWRESRGWCGGDVLGRLSCEIKILHGLSLISLLVWQRPSYLHPPRKLLV